MRCWRGMAVGVCAVALSWTLIGGVQAWASGSASFFSLLAGAGESLTEPRLAAVAATLPSGQVLIAGGRNGSGFLSSAELFNPATDTFTKLTGTLTEARLGAVAAVLPGGQVLIAGGVNGTRGYLSSAELFNPAADMFTKLTGTLTEGRAGAVAATLPSGEVLIAGGIGEANDDLSSAELFNPATDTFAKLTGAGQSLNEKRAGAVASRLPSGEVLIAGGSKESDSLSSAELFNPATDTFTKLAGPEQSLTEPRGDAVAATLPSGALLIAGGELSRGANSAGVQRAPPSTSRVRNSSTPLRTRLRSSRARLPKHASRGSRRCSRPGTSWSRAALTVVAPCRARNSSSRRRRRRSRAVASANRSSASTRPSGG